MQAVTAQRLFSAPPAMLVSLQGTNNETNNIPSQGSSPWATVAVHNVTANDVEIALERAQVNSGSITNSEAMGILALPDAVTGTFIANDGAAVSYESHRSADTITGWDDGCSNTSFLNTYSSVPLVLASIATRDGGDGGWLRRCSLSEGAVGLTVDEDTYSDVERNHTTEIASLIVFSRAFAAKLLDYDNNYWQLEAGQVTLNNTTITPEFTSVSFKQSYDEIPLIFALPTNEGGEPASVRVRNITSSGFEISQIEPANNDGVHASMTVHYLVVTPGIHRFPDGTWLEARIENVSAVQHGAGVSGTTGWHVMTFSSYISTSTIVSDPIVDFRYVYDHNGNRLRLDVNTSGSTYDYKLASNVMQLSGVTNIEHDSNGNTTNDGKHSYDYNVYNQLIGVDGSISYGYNTHGQRTSKQTNGKLTAFVYTTDGKVLAEYENGNLAAEYVYRNDIPIAVIKQDNIYYIHTDQLGIPRAVSDATQKIVWTWASDPFGNTAANDDPDGDGVAFTLNLRFAGQYYDSETGLHYNYFRYYDPKTGRYITSDPIGLAGGLNTYAYVGENPLTHIDFYGLAKTIKNGIFPWDIRNGNWGGSCWSGGQYSCGKNGIGDKPPLDSADALYMEHDLCYVKCKNNLKKAKDCNGDPDLNKDGYTTLYEEMQANNAGGKEYNSCQASCDKKLRNSLKALDSDPSKWPMPPPKGTNQDTENFINRVLLWY